MRRIIMRSIIGSAVLFVAIQVIRPNVRASQIDAAARDRLKARGLGDAFGHGTGHGLGVGVHEEPRIGPRRESATPQGARPGPPVAAFPPADQVIEPRMVFTIEPGAYIPGWGGVRIEDDVLVTGDGSELLTTVPYGLTVG